MTNQLHASALGALILIAPAATLLRRDRRKSAHANRRATRPSHSRLRMFQHRVPCPGCGRKLKSKSGVNTHRKAMAH